MGPHQVLAGRVIGAAIGLLTGTRYTDMSAFRAIRADALTALGMREMTYGWNLEMQMRAAQQRLRVREVPLPYRRRIAGESKVAGNLRGTLKAGGRIVATLGRTALSGKRPRLERDGTGCLNSGSSPIQPGGQGGDESWRKARQTARRALGRG